MESGVKKLTVEGQIATGEVPFVSLTKSIGFFEKIDLSSIQYAEGAQVSVEDLTDNTVLNLIEYNIDTTLNGNIFTIRVYGPDINDPNALSFVGQVDHSYKLNIDYEGENYTSITKIPAGTGLDSLWLEPYAPNPVSFKVLWVIYDDPDTLGNNALYRTRRRSLGVGTNNGWEEAFDNDFDDVVINGSRLPFNMDVGFDASDSTFDFQTANLVRRGDSIDIRWTAVDRPVYDFWNTLSFSEGSLGNPFASPVQVKSNISNDAYGVWAGYGHNYYTIIDSL